MSKGFFAEQEKQARWKHARAGSKSPVTTQEHDSQRGETSPTDVGQAEQEEEEEEARLEAWSSGGGRAERRSHHKGGASSLAAPSSRQPPSPSPWPFPVLVPPESLGWKSTPSASEVAATAETTAAETAAKAAAAEAAAIAAEALVDWGPGPIWVAGFAAEALEQLKCGVCLEYLDRCVVSPCLHRFCQGCIEKYAAGARTRTLPAPRCSRGCSPM